MKRYDGIRELSRDIHEQLFTNTVGCTPTVAEVANAIASKRRCPFRDIGPREFDRLCRAVWAELIKDPYPFGDTP